MKDLLDKLSSYNIFNYLFPGIVFVVVLQKITSYSLLQKDIVIGVFVYYFVGLVISRIGSLCIEPILKKLTFLKFIEYSEFISASKVDQKIDLLSEVNNMYRTICSMFLMLLVIKSYENAESYYPLLKNLAPILLALILFVIFLFSYRKQTNYITKRVKSAKLKE
jgi:hypothetical protein